MITSSRSRLALLERKGIQPINRNDFPDLNFDEKSFTTDLAYRVRYLSSERTFLSIVKEQTAGEGVLIFIDNIGSPVYRATLKALARQGVITTCGWKHGMVLSHLRAVECIERHIHVHTHGGRYTESLTAMQFSEEHNWIPQPEESAIYDWDSIPLLAKDYAEEKISSYFPLYKVHPD
jgi:NADPH:quinone reductase-like Zn-dependent oxidoreductase